jgi:hypothetical protein
LPEVFRHVVAHGEVDRHTHQNLKLIFEAGDVEQGDFADHWWRGRGEQIEVTPFVIIASSGRTEGGRDCREFSNLVVLSTTEGVCMALVVKSICAKATRFLGPGF